MSPSVLMSLASRSLWLNAEMLMGTRLMFSSRLCAVTITSSSAGPADVSASAATALLFVTMAHRAKPIALDRRRSVLFIFHPPVGTHVWISCPVAESHLVERPWSIIVRRKRLKQALDRGGYAPAGLPWMSISTFIALFHGSQALGARHHTARGS